MRVAFIPTNVSGVQYYRCWQPAEAMRKLGAQVAVLWYQSKMFTMHPWEEDVAHPGNSIRSDVERACDWADVVIWMGLHSPNSYNLFLEMKMKYDKPHLMEIDDYIFSIPAKNIASSVYKPGSDLTRILKAQIQQSDGVVCSTPYLAEMYKPLNPNCFVIENSIDLAPWRGRPSPTRRGATIGWMGGGTHDDDHEMIADAVKEVLALEKSAKFTYICGKDRPEFFEGVDRLKWDFKFWDVTTYAKKISRMGFDIGIAPLVDNNFNRGKSNLRWLEYSAMGIPTVASPLPHFKQAIKHGKTGFLADSHKEWVESLRSLINAPEVRANVGKAARQEVQDKWSPKRMGQRYIALLKRIANGCLHKPERP